MRPTLTQNSDFQATSLDWLGEFPSRWNVEPGLAVLRERQVKNIGLVEPTVLSLSYGRVVIKPQEKLRGLVPESFETYQIVEPGNIIIRPTDLQNDHVSLRVGQAKDRGIITSAYICLETKGKLTEDYAHLLLNAYDLKKVFYGLGSGLRQNLSWVDFRRLPIPVPPREEQAQIVRFIRHLDFRVNRLIKNKRRLIELLNEQRAAVIQAIVTGAKVAQNEMKPCRVAGVSNIPVHWEVRRFRTLVKRIDQGISPQAEAQTADDGWWGVLKAGCANDGVFRDTEHKRLPNDFDVDEKHAVQVGDVIISRASGSPRLVGSVARVQQLNYRLILSDKTFRPVFRDPRLVDFIVAAMNSPYLRIQVEQAISGAEGLANNLPVSELLDFALVMPPPDEADRVYQSLLDELRPIQTVVSRTESEIDLIREYRTRLVADVVTGQLDLRHLDLPEVEESLIEAIDVGEGNEIEELDEQEAKA